MLKSNHLIISVKKTECMYFHFPKKSISMSDLIPFVNQTLNITETYKYLGAFLSSHLTYQNGIHKLMKKLNQKLYVYDEIRPYLIHIVSQFVPSPKETIEPIPQLHNRTYENGMANSLLGLTTVLHCHILTP